MSALSPLFVAKQKPVTQQQCDLVLVDMGHVIAYRFFATMRWYKHAHPARFEAKDWTDFYRVFEKRFIETIVNEPKRHGCTAAETVLAMDDRRQNVWRRNIFPEYKAQRGSANDVPALSEALTLVHQKLLPQLQDLGFLTVSVNELEADDIIAVAVKCVRDLENQQQVGTSNSETKRAMIVVISADKDMLQLKDDRLYQYSIDGKFVEPVPDLRKAKIAHILTGDAVDNIPACFPKCGPKTAATLAGDAAALAKKLEDPAIRSRYERNELLIDMSNIPDDLVNHAMEKLKEIVARVLLRVARRVS